MLVEFSLKLKNGFLGGSEIQFLELEWNEELTKNELVDRFNAWLYDQDFIEKRLPSLATADFCQLSINPLKS